MEKKPLTTDQKIDLILKYAKSERHWAIFRGVISALFFFIFVVLPIIGSFYLVDYAKNNVNWSEWDKNIQQMKNQFKNLQSLNLQMGGQLSGDIQQALLKTPKIMQKVPKK